jgi:16S rRNA processing protein RimM
MMNDLLQIGRIIGTHGIKGEVTVFPLTDDPRRFSILKDCYLMKEDDASKVPAMAVSAKYSNSRVILRLEGIDDRDAALALKGRIIAVSRENAVKLAPGSYFICDIIGSRMIDDDSGETLGILGDILQTGSSDIYVVKRENQKDLLLPAIKEVIKAIDIASMTIRVHLIDGLLDL